MESGQFTNIHACMYLVKTRSTRSRRDAVEAERLRQRKTATRQQARTAATKEKLLEAAGRIFARDGFEAARLEDIASAAGYTRGAFYAHFKTKEDLFFALLEEEGRRRLEQVRAVVEGHETTHERLAALRSLYIDFSADRQWAMLILEFKLYALRHPELRPRLAGTHRRIRTSLNFEAVAEPDEPRRVALEAFLGALTLEHAYDPKRLPGSQLRQLLGTLFDVLADLRA